MFYIHFCTGDLSAVLPLTFTTYVMNMLDITPTLSVILMKTLSCSRKIPPSYAMRSHVRDSDPSEKHLRFVLHNWEYSKWLQKLQNSRLSQSVIQAVEQQVADGWMNVVRRERGGGCPAQFFFIDINHHHHTYQTSTQNFQLKFIIKWREGQELTRDGAWLIILTGDRWGEQSLIVRIVIRSPRLSLILLSPHQSRPRPGLRLSDNHTTHNSPILTLSQRISDSQL